MKMERDFYKNTVDAYWANQFLEIQFTLFYLEK